MTCERFYLYGLVNRVGAVLKMEDFGADGTEQLFKVLVGAKMSLGFTRNERLCVYVDDVIIYLKIH